VTTAFDQAIVVTASDGVGPTGPSRFTWLVPTGWEQGRGAWGGLVVGACLEAVQQAGVAADGADADGSQARPVRTVTAHLMGPVLAGTANVEVAAVRVGSSMSTWSARVLDDSGDTLAEAMVICGQARAEDLGHLASVGTAVPPKVSPWQDCPVIKIEPPLGPAFAAHLEFRPIEGSPMSGSAARVLGWIRLPDQGPWSAVQALSIVDAYWPSMYPTLPGPRPMATVSFSAHLLVDPHDLPAGEPLLFQASMAAARDGFTTETRRLWSADGRLVVENMQSIVVIR